MVTWEGSNNCHEIVQIPLQEVIYLNLGHVTNRSSHHNTAAQVDYCVGQQKHMVRVARYIQHATDESDIKFPYNVQNLSKHMFYSHDPSIQRLPR